jgi:DNA-directed RNA polymerase specialized sigma24 family protein
LLLVGELVQRALDGDDAAMELILHRYKGAVFAYTRRSFFDDILAEEVAQDTVLEAARKLATFKRKGSLRGWSRRSTRFPSRNGSRSPWCIGGFSQQAARRIAGSCGAGDD